MIASIPEEFQLSTGFSNRVKNVMNRVFGESPVEQSRERELFYLRGLNQYNNWLQTNNEKTMKIMEFLGQIFKKQIQFPKFEIGVLKQQNLVFENKKFSLVAKEKDKENITGYLYRIYQYLGLKDNFNKIKNNLKYAFYAFRDAFGDDFDIEFFVDFLEENKIKNIPYKHYGSEDKLVFDVNTNEFTWKKLPNPPPKKPQQVASTPFELNESRCADYLKELNLNETEEKTFVDDSLIKHLHVYLKNRIVHYVEAKDNQAWYVDDIVDHFYDKSMKKWFYTVKWKKYSDAEAFEDTDEPLSNVTNCESLIIAHHKRQSSYKRFNLKQIEERIAKAKGKNKRKLDAQLMKPDETPIMDNELPRQTDDEDLIQRSNGLKDSLLKPSAKKQRLY